MYTYPPFDPKEMEVIGAHASSLACPMFPNMPPEPLFNRPITPRENLQRMCEGRNHAWIPQTGWCFCDVANYRPRDIADNYATHLVFDGGAFIEYDSNTKRGWFNLDWVFVPVANGATVKYVGVPNVKEFIKAQEA